MAARWDLAIIVGSLAARVLWGVAFANILRGVPIDADLEYVGGFFNLLNPYALLGGADDAAAVPHPRRDVHRAEDRRRDPAPGPCPGPAGRGRRSGRRRALPRLDAGRDRDAWPRRWRSCGAAVALVGGARASRRRAARAGRSWAPSSRSRLGVAGLFLALFPDVMPTTLATGTSLTTTNAAATAYTLKIMTVSP